MCVCLCRIITLRGWGSASATCLPGYSTIPGRCGPGCASGRPASDSAEGERCTIMMDVCPQAVSPFIDANTKNRIHFVNNKKDVERMLPPLLDMSQVERCMSGTSDYVYK